MALTYTDQHTIAYDRTYEKFVIIGANRVANDWLNKSGNQYMAGQKIFETSETIEGVVTAINQKAESYRAKMHNLCTQVTNQNRAKFEALQTLIAVIIADAMPDLTMNELASNLGDLIQSQEGAFNAIMFSALERVAGVSPAEKKEYDDLPVNV